MLIHHRKLTLHTSLISSLNEQASEVHDFQKQVHCGRRDPTPFSQTHSCGLHLVLLGLGAILCQVTSCQVLLTWRTGGILDSTRWAWPSPSSSAVLASGPSAWHHFPAAKINSTFQLLPALPELDLPSYFRCSKESPRLRGLTSSSGSELDAASKVPYSDNPRCSPSFPPPVLWVVTASCVFVFIPSGLPVTSFFFFFLFSILTVV